MTIFCQFSANRDMVRVRTCFGVPKTRKLTQEMSEIRKGKVPRNLDFSVLFGALEGRPLFKE